MRALRTLVAACGLAAATLAHAGTGVMHIPGLADDGDVTVFYPTAAPDQTVPRGPFQLQLAPDAAPARGNGRLVIVSHGSGGGPWVHSDIARALVAAGFVAAMPMHRGDNWNDMSAQGPESWKTRPAEVSRAIDAVARHPVLGTLVNTDKVGVVGQSAGGHTALTLAGGQWSPARFNAHCQANIEVDFPACVGTYTRLTGGLLDPVKVTVARAALRQRFGDDAQPQAHVDKRIAVAVAGVPASADFDLATLEKPAIPLGLVTSAGDIWLKPRFHSDRVLAACQPRCELLAHVATGGHNIMLSPLPPMDVLGTLERELLSDPPGFDRTQLRALDQTIVSFLRRDLPS